MVLKELIFKSRKVETVKNEFFQDQHTLPKYQLLKMNHLKTTILSQSVKCLKSVLSRPPYSPNVETVKSQFFQATTPSNHRMCKKSVLSRPSHPPKLSPVKIQFFQDHHTLPMLKQLKISSFKTTTPSQSRNC